MYQYKYISFLVTKPRPIEASVTLWNTIFLLLLSGFFCVYLIHLLHLHWLEHCFNGNAGGWSKEKAKENICHQKKAFCWSKSRGHTMPLLFYLHQCFFLDWFLFAIHGLWFFSVSFLLGVCCFCFLWIPKWVFSRNWLWFLCIVYLIIFLARFRCLLMNLG